MLKLHADVAVDRFDMRLAGASRPFVCATQARLSGDAAVARQATAPPQTRPVRGSSCLPAGLLILLCCAGRLPYSCIARMRLR